MSLVLASPGHGKSTLLRALAGQVPGAMVDGSITYGGLSAGELVAKGVNLGLLSYFVDQTDNHLPFLTVRETVAFAAALSTVDPKHLGHPELVAAAEQRADRIVHVLHLTLCANTLVGNAAVRGVSGGERKRVSIAEALASNARLLCLDEIRREITRGRKRFLFLIACADSIAAMGCAARAWTRRLRTTSSPPSARGRGL